MARTVGSDGAKTMAAIRRAGISRIYREGYEGMKLRDLAEDAGIQAGSLYNYIRTKQEFLFDLLREIMEELHEEYTAGVLPGETPRAAISRFVAFHLRWHTVRREETFIGNMELRSLSPGQRAKIVAMRRDYEAELTTILECGNAEGAWRVQDARITTYAILAMLTGVCTWWQPGGRLGSEELIALYTTLTLQMLGADAPSAT